MTESDTDEPNSDSNDEPNAGDTVDHQHTEHGTSFDRWAKQVWAAGSYADIAPKYLSMSGRLVERTAVSAADDVLDIGCGTGSVAITAARRDGHVTGLDITPELLERARTNADRAAVEGISWREGTATDLPFAENAFDVTLSNLGHMYGDPPDTAARELLRVTRSGGRIGFTSWTTASLYPSMAGVVTSVLAPEDLPDFSEPPFLWGDPGTVRERLGSAVRELEFETDTVRYPALSPEHFWHQMATNSGTFIEVLDSVDDEEVPGLRERVIETIEPHFDEERNAVELEYLLTTASVTGSE
ncbi:methyltransferase domain-containing protein [Natronorubrum sp. JWXQ-INN-674]|uniref:Methyltransferase domain-containing protein n=1 Tax=Natronorubrum halalkaliphilum TaxID=2691917 RepID=A0A6B0VJK6_9EURY|nr:class I SAM-dependent methyltransferase [Natronorubrum halalkaliphilum]MXV61275.1 methyltransferase domain-containing protein [Natronorubrum halalkaliphilum]